VEVQKRSNGANERSCSPLPGKTVSFRPILQTAGPEQKFMRLSLRKKFQRRGWVNYKDREARKQRVDYLLRGEVRRKPTPV